MIQGLKQWLNRFGRFNSRVGIRVKVNIDSGGKPNGIPERRRNERTSGRDKKGAAGKEQISTAEPCHKESV